MSGTMPAYRSRRRDTRRVGHGRRALLAVVGMVGAIVVTDGIVGERGLMGLLHLRQEVAALEADVAEGTAVNERLRVDVERCRRDPSAIEELARRELGLIKPGEKVFIIRDIPAARQAERPCVPCPSGAGVSTPARGHRCAPCDASTAPSTR